MLADAIFACGPMKFRARTATVRRVAPAAEQFTAINERAVGAARAGYAMISNVYFPCGTCTIGTGNRRLSRPTDQL